ncbi:MAG: hypothetical protein LC746_08215, partial [Acidobacteria bacterium]|nr:hypothetical protein [Acidobacteriota bacterium]
MSEREEVSKSGADDVTSRADEPRSAAESLDERLRETATPSERRTLTQLARGVASLPADRARVVLEVSAQLAPVSLRACGEFLRAASEAARVLDAEELRAWGELGRRLANADTETGAQFFAAGASAIADVPARARAALLEVCARQMSLSSSIAVETFRGAGDVARAVGDAEQLAHVFRIAVEIARRSARHSANFINAAPTIFAHVKKNFPPDERARVIRESLKLAEAFAARAGGMASDVWASLPAATAGLDAGRALALFDAAEGFLERGGAAALHVLVAGGEVMRLAPEVFDEWAALARAVAGQGNAALVALARSSPDFFRALARRSATHARAVELSRRVVSVVAEVARADAEAAISCLKSAPAALSSATVEQFERWAREGLTQPRTDARARRSYYALETKRSNDALRGAGQGDEARAGLALEGVAQTLRLYVEGLTGRAVDVAPLAAVPQESRIGDGRTIQLPAAVSEFADDALNFRLYKVLAAHAAGQIEFGTRARAGSDAPRRREEASRGGGGEPEHGGAEGRRGVRASQSGEAESRAVAGERRVDEEARHVAEEESRVGQELRAAYASLAVVYD